MRGLVTLIALAALTACAKPAPDQAAPVPSGFASDGDAASAGASPSAAAPASVTPPAKQVTAAPSESRDPAKVVIAWAKAMTVKDWSSAYLYWGDHGARSGLTPAQFAAKWGKLANPEFELHPGTTEGAAGSLYYTAPIVLIDGQRHVPGEIVLRRVNDVDGASAEQLRWHIESLTAGP